jgi:hypothetical protein
VDERVAKGWDGGSATVLAGGVHFRGKDGSGASVSTSHTRPTNEAYIKVHVPGQRKGSFQIVVADPRVTFDDSMDVGTSSAQSQPETRSSAVAAVAAAPVVATAAAAAAAASAMPAHHTTPSGKQSEDDSSSDGWDECDDSSMEQEGSSVKTRAIDLDVCRHGNESSSSSGSSSSDSDEMMDERIQSEDIEYSHEFDQLLKIKIAAGSAFEIRVRGVSAHSVADRSQDMLYAVLAKLVPFMEGQYASYRLQLTAHARQRGISSTRMRPSSAIWCR